MDKLKTVLEHYRNQREKGIKEEGSNAVWLVTFTLQGKDKAWHDLRTGLEMFFTSNKSFEDIAAKRKFRLFDKDVQLIQHNNAIQLQNVDEGYVTFTDENEIRELILGVVINNSYSFFYKKKPEELNSKKLVEQFIDLLEDNDGLEEILFSEYIADVEDNFLKIGKRLVSVNEVEHLITNNGKTLNKDNKDHHLVEGLYSHKNDSIEYERNRSNHSKLNTILHEVLHGMIDFSNIKFTDLVEQHESDNAKIEEEVVTKLTNVATMIILDNPKFLEKLSGLLVNEELDASGVDKYYVSGAEKFLTKINADIQQLGAREESLKKKLAESELKAKLLGE